MGNLLRACNIVAGVMTLAVMGFVLGSGTAFKSLPMMFLAINLLMACLGFVIGILLSRGPSNGPPPIMGRVVARRIIATETAQGKPQSSFLLRVMSPNGLGERWVEVSRESFEYHMVSSLYVAGR
jgi:hypothetical protein